MPLALTCAVNNCSAGASSLETLTSCTSSDKGTLERREQRAAQTNAARVRTKASALKTIIHLEPRLRTSLAMTRSHADNGRRRKKSVKVRQHDNRCSLLRNRKA